MGKTVAMAFELSACLLLLFSIGGATALSSSGNSLEDGLPQPQALMVPLTIISSDIASPKGAVCLDGTLPAYRISRGFGSGADNWLIQIEGGGWCDTVRDCVYRKTSRHGSSNYMEKEAPFIGILSNKAEENPDFFNWNRVKLLYCDGASFMGNSEDKEARLFFRGQQIWSAAMEELMSLGMNKAKQALLSGCSAGGLSSIFHCDEYRALFPQTTKVKCLSDAGMFLDVIDITGGRTLRNIYNSVVNLHGLQGMLSKTCRNHLDPTSCFFPQNLIADIKTPMFLLNTAYDAWQVQSSLVPPHSDPHGYWKDCRSNIALCNKSQLQFLQDFRNQMLQQIKAFSSSDQNGLFINSCFAHCQSEIQDTWFASNGPKVNNKGIAQSVGDWYFDRTGVKAIDCPYPCDKTCHNFVFE
ncbi:hypothetical protein DCAR_0100898 [Daucus carota subsp. sativus]|uniref:Pectin acetylesterase n=1 Tax=Daucus carota subsp. sativus TaxID=79200 RepID=A0AAF0W236_DAUCS|nr:PREDICTED: pectin acetylesterase 6-like [Daucus carota subsp. sativus]WOG81747.1 hypothetical protein DCAR_0100898 [Daucus carota subsp. sativus]